MRSYFLPSLEVTDHHWSPGWHWNDTLKLLALLSADKQNPFLMIIS